MTIEMIVIRILLITDIVNLYIVNDNNFLNLIETNSTNNNYFIIENLNPMTDLKQ